MINKHIGQRLKKRPKKYISPFKLSGCRPNVPLTKALALRNKIAADPALKQKVFIDFSIFCSFDGNDLLTSFANDKDGDSSVLDFTVHCLRYDDIVHKEDSVGYRVFLTTGFFCQAMSVQSIYMDDGLTETDDFKTLWQCLESEIEHYEDILKAKLVNLLLHLFNYPLATAVSLLCN